MPAPFHRNPVTLMYLAGAVLLLLGAGPAPPFRRILRRILGRRGGHMDVAVTAGGGAAGQRSAGHSLYSGLVSLALRPGTAYAEARCRARRAGRGPIYWVPPSQINHV